MIEIAFDKNLDASFRSQEYPLLDVPDLHDKKFADYVVYAEDIFRQYKSEKYLIVIADDKKFNFNKLALAFFIASCFDSKNAAECLVIKTIDYEAAFAGYKPYIAVSIGIKYALRLAAEDVGTIYKELKCLNYLNFSIKEDYIENSIHYVSHSSNGSSCVADNVFEALVLASSYKILALAEIETPFDVIIHITKEKGTLNTEKMVDEILRNISDFIDI